VIVIDASALAAIVLKEEGWERLLNLSDLFLTLTLALVEVANAIWKAYQVGRLSIEEAREAYHILHDLAQINLLLEDPTPYLPQALNYALTSGVSVYDALYIELASTKALPLLTLDQKQKKAARKRGIRTLPK